MIGPVLENITESQKDTVEQCKKVKWRHFVASPSHTGIVPLG